MSTLFSGYSTIFLLPKKGISGKQHFRMKGGESWEDECPKRSVCWNSDDCRDLELGEKILARQKKIAYGLEPAEDTMHVNAFNCPSPLCYIESSRIRSPHHGRCRDEGLLLVLLDGKNVLDYSHKEFIELSLERRRHEAAKKAA